MRTLPYGISAAMICAAAPGMALAGMATAQLGVSTTVIDICNVEAADLSFGNYSANAASPVNANTSLSVTCTTALAYTVSLDGGTTTGQPGARAMSDGASHNLYYGLYTNSARTTALGDGNGATATMGGSGNGSAQTLTIYGQIPAAQYTAPGSYSDHITVTVAY
jgi:spore coat protein U-like protein